MRRAPLFSLVLWSTVIPGAALVGCGKDHPLVDAAGMPNTDIPVGGAVEFGDANCGDTPTPQTFAFHNTGSGTLTWSASIDGTGFAITAGASGSAEPGETAEITISADPIPSTTAVGGQVSATLVLTTNAASTAFSLPLSVTAHGGSIHVGTPTVGFGQIQLTSPADQALEITNVGDRPIDLALGTPTDTDFTATWTGAPAAATVQPNDALLGASAHFVPTTAGVKTETLPITATGPVCAGDAPSVALGGEGTTAQVSISPGTLQFGTTACGATATSQKVTIQNDYGFAITYTAAITGGPYTITAGQATGSVPANGSVQITIKANAVPKTAGSIVASALAGTMTVSTSAPASTPASLTMAQAATGAILALTPAGGSTIDFGDVAAGTPGTKPFSVKNTGNVAAAVTSAVTGSGYTVVNPGGGSIPSTGVATAGSVTETVAQRGTHAGTLTLSTTTALCQAAAPTAITLTSVGKAAVASVGNAPGMTSTCGVANPSTVNVTVQNTGDEPLVISSASVTGGFSVTSTIPMTIQPATSGTVTVRPPAAVVGTDAAGSTKTGTLSLVTNEIGTPTRNVSLTSTVTGAVLALTPAPGGTINFGNVDVGTPSSQAFSVKNTGNLAATVTVGVTGTGYTATTPNGGAIPANGVAQGASVTQTVSAHGTTTGTLGISSSTAQCTATPGNLNLTAFDRTPTAVVGAAPAMSATCGAGTPGAVSVSVQNTGDGPLVISSASTTGGFVVTSTLPMTIAAGTTSSISVRPPAPVIGTDLGGSTKNGTVTLTTNELTGNSHVVGVSSLVIGANLSFENAAGAPITSVSFSTSGNCPGSQTIFVTNTGNATAANLQITTAEQTGGFEFFGFSPSTTLAPSSSASHILLAYTLADGDQCVAAQTIQYTATGSICSATPFGLQASYTIGNGTSCFCS